MQFNSNPLLEFSLPFRHRKCSQSGYVDAARRRIEFAFSGQLSKFAPCLLRDAVRMAIDEEFDPVASASRPSRHKLREAKQAALNGTKLKLSVSQQRKANLPGHESGPGWDRELDSDPDEPLAIEEQFILRVPDALAPELRGMVESRNVNGDLWFKFKDSRRAVFHLGKKLYGAKLVDLPALVESQKLTGSGGAAVKVADISQMLLVEEEIKEEAEVTKDKAFNIEDFIFPHGITPPLKHVRKRRFRKRVNKRVRPSVVMISALSDLRFLAQTIEVVESAVEKLLEDDARADDVKYGQSRFSSRVSRILTDLARRRTARPRSFRLGVRFRRPARRSPLHQARQTRRTRRRRDFPRRRAGRRGGRRRRCGLRIRQ